MYRWVSTMPAEDWDIGFPEVGVTGDWVPPMMDAENGTLLFCKSGIALNTWSISSASYILVFSQCFRKCTQWWWSRVMTEPGCREVVNNKIKNKLEGNSQSWTFSSDLSRMAIENSGNRCEKAWLEIWILCPATQMIIE